MTEVLKVNNLRTQFKTEGGLVKAVDGLSYYIDEQEIIWWERAAAESRSASFP